MPDLARLARVKELIEKGEEQAIAGGVQRKEQVEHIESIVERLKKREGKPEAAEARVLRIRSRLEGIATQTMDFEKLQLDRVADEKIRTIGKFYNAFRTPVTVIASFFANLPVAGELQSNLRAADIEMRPEAYIVISSTLAFVLAIMAVVVTTYAGASAGSQTDLLATASLALIVGGLVFLIVGVGLLVYPTARAESRAQQIDRELPFALRQLATQIKAGVSFQKALASVADAGYGILSAEFKRVLKEVESGKTTDQAMLALHDRTRSKGLRQATMQIMRTLKTGGGLADIMTGIANDVSFETRMRVRDFTEELNLINVIFIMTAVVAPVVLTIIVSIMQLPLLGGGVSQLLVVGAFATIIIGMLTIIFLIKKIEPVAG